MASPIEAKLLAAVIGNVPEDFTVTDWKDHGCRIDQITKSWGRITCELSSGGLYTSEESEEYGNGSIDLWLYENVKVLTYRADFVFGIDGHNLFAVECDGHDFHDRTKQQAAMDRSRDRELLRMGLPTMRFTGSEIHHYAEACAAEIFALARTLDSVSTENQFMWCAAHRTGEERAAKAAGHRMGDG